MNRPVRVLVTGAAGQVGVDLVDTLEGRVPPGGRDGRPLDGSAVGAGEFEVLGLTHHDLDVSHRGDVERALAASRPDVVVHLAAYTKVDAAQRDVSRCFAVNADGVGHVVDAASAVGAHVIAVSTDYVFDGRKGAAYREDDLTNPQSVYGASKRAGEERCPPEVTLVRASWIMGVRGTSVVHTMARRAREGQEVRFVTDQRGTITASADLAAGLVALVRARPGGVWHVANDGDATWFDVAQHVGRVLGRGDDFARPILTSDLEPPPLAARPERSDLDTTTWRQHFAPLGPWRESVERLVTWGSDSR